MSENVQNPSFTRYVYQNTYLSMRNRNTFNKPHKMIKGDFDQFILSNTIYPFGLEIKKVNKLSLRITIEPFKYFNSKSRGVVLYLQNDFPYSQDVTGLRPTKHQNVYYGDFYKINDKGVKTKDLVLVQVLEKSKELIIDVYYGYYPKNSIERMKIIDEHHWHEKTTPRSGFKSFKTLSAINK